MCKFFFWNNMDGSNKTHWVRWEKMCLLVAEGDLGLRHNQDITNAYAIKLGGGLSLRHIQDIAKAYAIKLGGA